MTNTYASHIPTPFDRHIRIDWEPSDELMQLEEQLAKAQNELAEDVEHEEHWLPIVDDLEKKVDALHELEDRERWLILSVSRTRDSGVHDNSNFESALKILGGESETCEVHRFGHWGPGWYEIIIVRPDRVKEVEDIERSLENYPILDETDLSMREDEEFQEAWSSYGASDLRRAWRHYVSDLCEEAIDDLDGNFLLDWWMENADEHCHHESSGCCIRIDRYEGKVTRKELARIIWNWRKKDATNNEVSCRRTQALLGQEDGRA